MNKYDSHMGQLTDFGGNVPPQSPNLVSEDDLKGLEQALGHSLPAVYREFLRHYGGYFVGSAVDLPDPKPNAISYGSVNIFYGIMPENSWSDIMSWYRRMGEGWPPEVVPIGGGDNGYLCITIAGERAGQISFWNSGETGEYLPENFHHVADSFDAFMQMLIR